MSVTKCTMYKDRHGVAHDTIEEASFADTQHPLHELCCKVLGLSPYYDDGGLRTFVIESHILETKLLSNNEFILKVLEILENRDEQV